MPRRTHADLIIAGAGDDSLEFECKQHGFDDLWNSVPFLTICEPRNTICEFRIKQKPKVKPSIDWAMYPEIVAIKVDNDEDLRINPKSQKENGCNNYIKSEHIKLIFPSFISGNCAPEDSYVERPIGV